MWKIAPNEAQQIEEAVRSELYGSIRSALGINYSRLRQLLWSQLWQEADQETENVILKALRQNLEPVDREALLQLPCVDLLTIDELWSRYSSGRFGFKAQQQVYQQVDRQPADFLRTLDWRGPRISLTGGIKPYKNLQFSASAPPGHLPTWRWCCPSLDSGYDVSDSIVEGLFRHLESASLWGHHRCRPPLPPWVTSKSIMVMTTDWTLSDLADLLKGEEWQAADKVTQALMRAAVNREGVGSLAAMDLAQIPCEILHDIDHLWVNASFGHFWLFGAAAPLHRARWYL
ncbi:MAG: hypothetical protein HC929_18295 [Leptolyngbyaceae cyanobacterium SM2_5_2]|nr:hypothetical protein [Leptolyngbyaceae cyanobacterium SM2_5_2]